MPTDPTTDAATDAATDPAGAEAQPLTPGEDPARVHEQTGRVIAAFLTEDRLEDLSAEARAATATPAMGAVVTFDGVVRDHDGGADVNALTYTAHPTAGDVMGEVVRDVVKRHPRARVWAAHRTGALAIGDTAFYVVVAAAHRAAAFAAATEVVDEVKARVPVWKEQEMADGTNHWVGLE